MCTDGTSRNVKTVAQEDTTLWSNWSPSPRARQNPFQNMRTPRNHPDTQPFHMNFVTCAFKLHSSDEYCVEVVKLYELHERWIKNASCERSLDTTSNKEESKARLEIKKLRSGLRENKAGVALVANYCPIEAVYNFLRQQSIINSELNFGDRASPWRNSPIQLRQRNEKLKEDSTSMQFFSLNPNIEPSHQFATIEASRWW